MKRIGWLEIILGVLMIGLGIYTMMNPDTALTAIVIAYAIAAIISGIVDFVVYYQMEKRRGFGSAMLIVSGILNVLVGILLLLNIGAGAWALSILFPVWFIVHCIARLANLDFIRAYSSKFAYWLTLIANVLGIIFGILILFNPFAGAVALIYFVAAFLLVEGLSSVVWGIGNLSGNY